MARLAPTHRFALCLGLLASVALPPSLTQAERITEDTAYVLEPKQVRIGLWKSEIGLWGADALERTTIGTSHIPWIAGLLGSGTYNVHVKHEWKRTSHYSVSLGAGLTRIDGAAFELPDSGVTVIPLDVTATTQLGRRVTLAAGLAHTLVRINHAAGQLGPIDELDGAIGTTTTQAHARAIVRVFDRLLVELGARSVITQDLHASISGEAGDMTVTNTTEVEMADVFDLRGAVSVSAVAHLKLGAFHLRAGAEYGNVNIPYLNFVLPHKTWVPRFDVFVRF